MGGKSNFARPMLPTYRGCTVLCSLTTVSNKHTTDIMTDDPRKQKGGVKKRREKLSKDANNQMRALMAQCNKKHAARRLIGAEESAFASSGNHDPQYRHNRGTEDLH